MASSFGDSDSTNIEYDSNEQADYTYDIEDDLTDEGAEEPEDDLIETANGNSNYVSTQEGAVGTPPMGEQNVNAIRPENDYTVMQSYQDMLGKEFETEETAEIFYKEYARSVGFGVRRHNKRWNVSGMLTGRKWVCSRQGWRHPKHLDKAIRKREPRPLTRTGCTAEFRISKEVDHDGWVCSYFNVEHNHELTPAEHVQFIPSHRRVGSPDLLEASTLHKVGVTASQIHQYMVERSGGYRNIECMRKDIQNRLDRKRRRQLKESDAETCLSYLDGMKGSDPGYYYDYTVDVHNRLGDLFWCDGGARADYALFGDVMAFDATYRTNVYRKPFVVILGINHHRRTTVFGFALLADETENTYIWMLETFMRAMNGKQPTTVITDGDRAMRNAVNKTFPEAVHRLCCWHLTRNAQTNISSKLFTVDFQRCMLQPYTLEIFESQWKIMVDKHRVSYNEWVKKMYEDKHMWAEAYLR